MRNVQPVTRTAPKVRITTTSVAMQAGCSPAPLTVRESPTRQFTTNLKPLKTKFEGNEAQPPTVTNSPAKDEDRKSMTVIEVDPSVKESSKKSKLPKLKKHPSQQKTLLSQRSPPSFDQMGESQKLFKTALDHARMPCSQHDFN